VVLSLRASINWYRAAKSQNLYWWWHRSLSGHVIDRYFLWKRCRVRTMDRKVRVLGMERSCRPVVDIDPQGSIGSPKGSINIHGVEWGHWMARGSMNNCWGLLKQWSLQFKIIVNRARNANGVFQQIKQN